MSKIAVSLFVRLWVEMHYQFSEQKKLVSASSWGCELKWMISSFCETCSHSQPLREAVSWNSFSGNKLSFNHGQPLREAVSWNVTILIVVLFAISQPLREAVSWNTIIGKRTKKHLLSASSWGCELKWSIEELGNEQEGQPLREAVSWNPPVLPEQ